MVTASLTNYRQSPRKVRLVASLITGKSVTNAMNILGVTTKRTSDPLAKLLASAVANAKNLGVATEGLFVKECRVDSGLTMKRHMPGARGSAFPIKKKTSHVLLVLGQKNVAIKAPKAEKVEKTEKKAVAPKKAAVKKN
jgi:large subunit ribosomal protein L22